MPEGSVLALNPLATHHIAKHIACTIVSTKTLPSQPPMARQLFCQLAVEWWVEADSTTLIGNAYAH